MQLTAGGGGQMGEEEAAQPTVGAQGTSLNTVHVTDVSD